MPVRQSADATLTEICVTGWHQGNRRPRESPERAIHFLKMASIVEQAAASRMEKTEARGQLSASLDLDRRHPIPRSRESWNRHHLTGATTSIPTSMYCPPPV